MNTEREHHKPFPALEALCKELPDMYWYMRELEREVDRLKEYERKYIGVIVALQKKEVSE